MDSDILYIIDTSSLIGLLDWRPPGKHRTVWERLDSLINADRLITPQEVYDELRVGKDPVARWAIRRKRSGKLFQTTTAQTVRITKQIIGNFPDLIEYDRPLPQADPFVIALALCEAKKTLGQKCIVITEEKYTPTGRSRIPPRVREASTALHDDPPNVRVGRLDVLNPRRG